jgi:hypothetical protein
MDERIRALLNGMRDMPESSGERALLEYSLGLQSAISILCADLVAQGVVDGHALAARFRDCAHALWPDGSAGMTALNSIADAVVVVSDER